MEAADTTPRAARAMAERAEKPTAVAPGQAGGAAGYLPDHGYSARAIKEATAAWPSGTRWRGPVEVYSHGFISGAFGVLFWVFEARTLDNLAAVKARLRELQGGLAWASEPTTRVGVLLARKSPRGPGPCECRQDLAH
jgi:hypothetical protein